MDATRPTVVACISMCGMEEEYVHISDVVSYNHYFGWYGGDRLMDAWGSTGQLPKTIVYSLNPADDAWLDTLLGAYQGTEVPGKIQHGSAWWFNDHRTGMVNQMTSLANLGILGNFIGMLTDSRSFLSYARHEYFRRILCNLIGTWVENGEYPADEATLGALVQDISFNNAKRYFGI